MIKKTQQEFVKSNKKRLFVDMDGCLAEWRNIILKITNIEQKDTVVKKLNQILLSPGYFRSLSPHQNVVAAINELNKEEDVEIYILSCVMKKKETPNPETEKIGWLEEFVPNIDKNHIIFVPDGENKTEYIPGGVQEGDFTLDDYSLNLRSFEKAGGIGIKLLNDVNESKGSWRGNAISKDANPKDIVRDLKLLMYGKVKTIKHNPPIKNREPLMEITEDTIIDINLE